MLLLAFRVRSVYLGGGSEGATPVELACIAGPHEVVRVCCQAVPKDSMRTIGSPAASEASRSMLPTIAKS